MSSAVSHCFRELTYAEAVSAARAEGRLLLVDFTASWCSPCRHMDNTTWRDERVRAWVDLNAVAIQVDVDRDDRTANTLGVKAMPTVVLFRDGAEIDRVTGARTAEQVLDWLDGAKRGRTEVDRLRELAPDDVHGRLHLARVLLLRGEAEGAVEQLERLWRHDLGQEGVWASVKHSFVAGVLADAVQASPRARAKVAALRDEVEHGLDDPEKFRDWCTLNRTLREEERTLSWFDSVKSKPPAALGLDRDAALAALLRAHGRWADLGALLKDPQENLRHAFGIVEETESMVASEQQTTDDREFRDHLLESTRQAFRQEAADLLRALLAAGRLDAAEQLRVEAARLEPSPDMAEALAGASHSPTPSRS